MKKAKYIFIVNEYGERQATYLIGKKNKEDLIARAHSEYPNCTVFEGTDDDFDQLVNNKLYINGEFVEKPPYVPPLETVQASKIAELKIIRNQKELEPIEYNGTMFDADKDSLDRLNYAIITLTVGNKDRLDWTTADNTNVQMSANDLSAVIAAVGLRSDTLHRRYRELKAIVQAAQTNEEVDAVSW